MNWLIREDIARAMARDRKDGTAPSALMCSEFDAKHQALVDKSLMAGESPRNMKIAGDVAEIAIEGALTRRCSWYASYYGGGNTTYPEIITALSLAQSDPTIKRVVLRINSPGGNVDGLFETLAALESFAKPIESKVSMACSAAYSIAALTNRIEGVTPASVFGSIGVACTYIVWDDEVTITSTNAPDKRPDVTTEEGKAVVRRELDAIHDLFVDAIARGRKTTVANVNKNFGRGAVVLCMEAMKLGMCDGQAMATPLRAVAAADCCPCAGDCNDSCPCDECEPSCACHTQETASAKAGGAHTEKHLMDLKTLKASHPDVYEAAVQEGVTAERKRVNAHLKMAKTSGAVDVAERAIASGASVLDEEVHSEYMSAAMNRADRSARQQETSAAAGATSNAAPKPHAEGGAGADASGAPIETADVGDAIVALWDEGKSKVHRSENKSA